MTIAHLRKKIDEWSEEGAKAIRDEGMGGCFEKELKEWFDFSPRTMKNLTVIDWHLRSATHH